MWFIDWKNITSNTEEEIDQTTDNNSLNNASSSIDSVNTGSSDGMSNFNTNINSEVNLEMQIDYIVIFIRVKLNEGNGLEKNMIDDYCNDRNFDLSKIYDSLSLWKKNVQKSSKNCWHIQKSSSNHPVPYRKYTIIVLKTATPQLTSCCSF